MQIMHGRQLFSHIYWTTQKSEQTLDPQIVLSFSQCQNLISIVEVKANRENISVQHMPWNTKLLPYSVCYWWHRDISSGFFSAYSYGLTLNVFSCNWKFRLSTPYGTPLCTRYKKNHYCLPSGHWQVNPWMLDEQVPPFWHGCWMQWSISDWHSSPV